MPRWRRAILLPPPVSALAVYYAGPPKSSGVSSPAHSGSQPEGPALSLETWVDSDHPQYLDFSAYLVGHPPQQPVHQVFRSGRATRYHASGDVYASVATVHRLSAARYRYSTPSDVYFYVLESNKRADQPPLRIIAVNEVVLEAGLRFPLHPAISELLSSWNLSITQVKPNEWSYILATMTLLDLVGAMHRPPSPEEVNYLMSLVSQLGGYYVA